MNDRPPGSGASGGAASEQRGPSGFAVSVPRDLSIIASRAARGPGRVERWALWHILVALKFRLRTDM
jgi:hypothetical protein